VGNRSPEVDAWFERYDDEALAAVVAAWIRDRDGG
jgi:hypothetical protein